MGTSLSGLTPATTFDGLLKTSDNDALDATLKTIGTGDGTDSVLQLSDSALQIGGTFNVDGGIATFKGVGSSYLTSSFIIKNSADAEIFRVRDDGQIYATYISAQSVNASSYALYGADYAPNIRVNIKGSGATSATTSLLVQNSAGSDLFKVTDDGATEFGTGGGLKINFRTITGAANSNKSIEISDATTYSTRNGHIFKTYDGTAYIEAMRINGVTNPFVGIGETTPTARLHIKGSGNDNTTTSLLVQNSAGTNIFKVVDDNTMFYHTHKFRSAGGYLYIEVEGNADRSLKMGPTFTATSYNGHIFKTFDGVSSYPEVMRITGNGDQFVGIGETTPTARLHVKGSGATSATTALLVENSAGALNLKVNDDGSVFSHGGGARTSSNTGFGEGVLASVTTANNTSAFGVGALRAVTTGVSNTGIGWRAGYATTGSNNSFVGLMAGYTNSSGANNTGFGTRVLYNNGTANNNTAAGYLADSAGFSGNVILGKEATATADNQFVVGSSTTNAGAVDVVGDPTPTHTWEVVINGVKYRILLQEVV